MIRFILRVRTRKNTKITIFFPVMWCCTT